MPFDDPSVRIEIESPHKAEIEILDKMLEILATPDRWCQGTLFNGRAYCLAGALFEADHGAIYPLQPTSRIGINVWKSFERQIGGFKVQDWNDGHNTTHADILGLLQRSRAEFE